MTGRLPLLAAALLASALWGQAPAPAPQPAPLAPPPGPTRFVRVELQLLSAGEKRPVREIGAFAASLPLGKPGKLERKLEIASASKGTQAEAELRLVLTPSVDEAGVLHCLTLAESTLSGQPSETRIKDLAFPHSGSQLMDLLADPATKTRIVLSVSAVLVDEPAPPPEWPPLRFGVRVEHWLGNAREEVEALQLQSLEGQSVSHTYTRQVPKVVEGRREGELVLEDLPVVEEGKEGTNLKAGESFVVKLAPEEASGKRKKKKKAQEPATPFAPAGPPQVSEERSSEETPHSLIWEEEFYTITLTPLQLSRGGMRLRVTMAGQIFDPLTGALQERLTLEQEKEVLPGQPVPFYLTQEMPNGAQGFVAWVLPYWQADAAAPPQ